MQGHGHGGVAGGWVSPMWFLVVSVAGEQAIRLSHCIPINIAEKYNVYVRQDKQPKSHDNSCKVQEGDNRMDGFAAEDGVGDAMLASTDRAGRGPHNCGIQTSAGGTQLQLKLCKLPADEQKGCGADLEPGQLIKAHSPRVPHAVAAPKPLPDWTSRDPLSCIARPSHGAAAAANSAPRGGRRGWRPDGRRGSRVEPRPGGSEVAPSRLTRRGDPGVFESVRLSHVLDESRRGAHQHGAAMRSVNLGASSPCSSQEGTGCESAGTPLGGHSPSWSPSRALKIRDSATFYVTANSLEASLSLPRNRYPLPPPAGGSSYHKSTSHSTQQAGPE